MSESIEEKALRAALIDIAAGKTTIGQAVQVARAALQPKASFCPACDLNVNACTCELGTPDPLTPEEAAALCRVLDTEGIDTAWFHPLAQTGMSKLRALASTEGDG